MTAKQLNRVRTTALVLLIFLFLLICVYVLSGAWQRGARYPLYRLSSPYEIGMNYEQQTGENSPASLSRHANFKGDFREQRYFLPEDDIPAPALRIYTADAILDVSMNGKELLSYGTPQLEAYSFVPGGYHLVTLPEDCAGAELTIRYTATALHTELFPGTPLYGNLQDIVSFWVSETRIVVYAGIFLCLFGFLLTSLWFLMRQSSGEDPQMFFAGLIAFLTGLYTLCRHDALFFFTNSCTLRTYIEAVTQLLFPVLIALLLRLLAHDLVEQRLFFFCAMIAAAFAVIVVMLQFLRIVPLTTGMRAARICFIGINLVLFAAGVRILRRWFLQFRRLRASALQDAPTAGHTGNLLLLSGILFLTLAMLADVLFEFFDLTPDEDRIIVHRILLAGTVLFTLLLLLRYFYHSVNDVMTSAGNARLTQLAYTDALTKLPNRAYCEIALDNLFREDRSFAVVSMDVNDLKKINDRDGHAAGDELLKNFADSLRTSFRSTDVCGRMSGDEFIAILYDVSPQEYEEKVRQVLTELPVSISFGAAHCDEVSARDAHAVYKLADERMYRMKQQIHEREAAYANA